tara:strand:- start:3 stop:182 length:180 start_codon:yes stop_codon:yes gene_type:complete
MQIIGYIFYVIGILDWVLGNFAGMDFTGVWWSPLAFGAIGAIFERIGASQSSSSEDSDN